MSDVSRGNHPLTIELSTVEPEHVRWLWHPYVPLGKITLLDGDPGIGKSWVALALATAVSRGRGLPGMTTQGEPANVLICSAEDGLADTIRPRLDGMRGDCSRIFALNEAIVFDGDGLTKFELAIAENHPKLTIIDPLVAFLGGRIDMRLANQTRAILAKLAEIADRHGCAILAVRHLTKGARDRSIYRGQGSIDFTAAARSVLLAGCDPDNPQERALAHIKSNLATFGPSVGFAIADGRFYWKGESGLTAAKMLSLESTEDERRAIDDATDLLQTVLAGGPLPAKQVENDATELGISSRTLRRARQRLHIKVRKIGQPKTSAQRWTWELPEGGQPPSRRRPSQEVGPLRQDTLPEGISTLFPLEGGQGMFVSRPPEDGHPTRRSKVGHLRDQNQPKVATRAGFTEDGQVGTVGTLREAVGILPEGCRSCAVLQDIDGPGSRCGMHKNVT